MTNDQLKKQLLKIQKHNGGSLSPSAVVDAARAEEHPLHGRFEWDDSKAGEAYRIEQARRMIRAVVTVINTGGAEIETRAFVSLSTTKGTPEPYININAVTNSRDLMDVLLADARRDAESFAAKYAILKKCKPVVTAMRRAKLIA